GYSSRPTRMLLTFAKLESPSPLLGAPATTSRATFPTRNVTGYSHRCLPRRRPVGTDQLASCSGPPQHRPASTPADRGPRLPRSTAVPGGTTPGRPCPD